MSIDHDGEILQDFLVEAGEILEQLGTQLIELERTPQDCDLLNAIFRGFHTVKGGAGFLHLTPMVEACHRAEDVFNVLRQGERQLDAALMDAVLQVLDLVNEQFRQISAGGEPQAADPALLARLEGYAGPGDGQGVQPSPAPAQPEAAGDITDTEFEALLEAVGEGAGGESVAAAGADEMTDDEFERLLDALHGAGKAPQGAAETGAGEPIAEAALEPLLDEPRGPAEPPGGEASRTPPPLRPAEGGAAVAERTAVKAPPRPAAEATVRVDTKRLDQIMNMVGELVLVRNRLATLRSSMQNEAVAKAIANLDLVTSDLQSAVMKTRMQPIKKVFGRFPRVVRDLARGLGKQVELELHGEDTDLDKNLVEALADPLVHLVRNAVDHGIERPEVRLQAGKPAAGRVVLAAEQEGDHILLTITDDGAGMDPQALRRKAVEKGLMDAEAAARLDDRDAYNLIFAPGFSTKSEISDVSGRGVGMDVVKTRIAQLNGSVDIDSEMGKGTRLRLKLPLTLAILPTLMVGVGRRTFALPLSSVSEIFHLDRGRTNVVDGQLCVRVRNRAMPLFYLREWLASGERASADGAAAHVVVTHVGNQKVGFVVDRVLGQEEVVIKPLGALLHGLAGFAGATITGDGCIALILDVPSLTRAHAQRF